MTPRDTIKALEEPKIEHINVEQIKWASMSDPKAAIPIEKSPHTWIRTRMLE